MSAPIRGVVPPVTVPLLDDRSLDLVSYQRQIDRLIDAGVDGLFILGSTGEVAFSTVERRREIIAASVDAIAGRVPCLVGVVDTQTDRVIEHIKTAEEFDIAGVVATAPFYALGGIPQIEQHFRLLRAATELPIYAYDIPVCVHTKLPVDLLISLALDGVLQGVKDSSGDDVAFRYLSLANRRAGKPLSLLTGHEVCVDAAYMAGADGCVPGLGNVDPDAYVRQWRAYQEGDWETVRTEQDRLAELMRVAMVARSATGFGAGVGGFKTALACMGIFATNQMPEPVSRLQGEDVQRVEDILAELGMV
ncbi:dihydrodipicolinate synthase family protein [Corynebacterium tapiri]|uniref:Dihydrodipicolinate synthase family protein n=1 Tax=Corynebacterium tapiri TaxID=1448266 RepID=A0A5C4U206_9CORY|nr:dihydrodipicolinate synthase family protein [Corynebacterium tapiri]TNL96070.1 dihydrodipicolinate synthase family protein [Corynebacterium tapiri]